MTRRRNPDVDPAAVDKYREFHRYDPKRVGPMAGLEIPARMRCAGVAKWVTYRSMKTDPETLKRPRKPIDYIHEHDAGVMVYLPDGDLDTDTPAVALEPDASLVLLGKCLGFKVVDHGGAELEAEGTDPLPELYCTADGKVLLVVQGKRELLAAMWGGALGVFARGIDG